MLLVRVSDLERERDFVIVGELLCVKDLVKLREIVGVKEFVKVDDLVECGVVGLGVKESVRLFVRERLFVKEELFVKVGDTDLDNDIVRVGEIDCVILFV